MWSQSAGSLWVELLDELIHIVEVFDPFAEHLELDFIEYLVGLVFPIHFCGSFNL